MQPLSSFLEVVIEEAKSRYPHDEWLIDSLKLSYRQCIRAEETEKRREVNRQHIDVQVSQLFTDMTALEKMT